MRSSISRWSSSLVVLLVAAGCSAAFENTDSSEGATSASAFEQYRQIRSQKEADLEQYKTDHREDMRWFTDVPVGNSGVPLLLFKLFPEIMPDLWPSNWPEQIGLPPAQDPKALLPYGLGWNMGSQPIVNLPGLSNFRMQVVNFTCGSCHTGRVVDDQGKEHVLMGAPNTRMNLALWRTKLAQTVRDPRFTIANFNGALANKSRGWLYGNTLLLPQEFLDTKVFQEKGDLILEGLKDRIGKTYDGVHDYLGAVGYDERTTPFLDGGGLGQLEGGFGSAISKLVPEEVASLPPAEKRARLLEFFTPQRYSVDIMSVWRQDDRATAQWDGNIQPKLLRNLGAELGIIPDPTLASYDNAVATTEFVRGLPPPPYPFDVDASKAARGRKIYEAACTSCHNNETKMVDLATIGTDPNRAPGLTPRARKALSGMMLAACKDKKNPDCNVPEDEVIADKSNPPGYLAGPLDGIWARAPYFHNGSVPTLEQVLVPERRAPKFHRGNLKYDQKGVGFAWSNGGADTQTYDTALPGYSNKGHSDVARFNGGIDFAKEPQKLDDLLEYMKTL